MSVELGKDEVFSAAVEGLPNVAELIATVPVEDRGRALEAAEQSYLETSRELGYPEAGCSAMGGGGHVSIAT